MSVLWYALVDKMWVQGPENRMQGTLAYADIISVPLHRDSQGKGHTQRTASHKTDISMLRYVSFMDKPEAPFGLEPFGLELKVEGLKVEGLMAERKHRGHLLTCISHGFE